MKVAVLCKNNRADKYKEEFEKAGITIDCIKNNFVSGISVFSLEGDYGAIMTIEKKLKEFYSNPNKGKRKHDCPYLKK